jgi:hypothetical protein
MEKKSSNNLWLINSLLSSANFLSPFNTGANLKQLEFLLRKRKTSVMSAHRLG